MHTDLSPQAKICQRLMQSRYRLMFFSASQMWRAIAVETCRTRSGFSSTDSSFATFLNVVRRAFSLITQTSFLKPRSVNHPGYSTTG